LNSKKSTHEELGQRVKGLEKEIAKRKQAERDLKIQITSLKDLNASLKFLVKRREEDAKGKLNPCRSCQFPRQEGYLRNS
jgi:hypothetical protein